MALIRSFRIGERITLDNKKFPKYIKSSDGEIGTFSHLDFGMFPVYRFESGSRLADCYELANGSNNREDFFKKSI